MKNKKGFTLTELLAVIALLVVITGTTIYGIDELSRRTKEKKLNDIIKEIELATDVYLMKNQVYREELLNGTIIEKCTRVYVLQNEELIDLDLINPTTNERIPANLCVKSYLNEKGIIENKFTLE